MSKSYDHEKLLDVDVVYLSVCQCPCLTFLFLFYTYIYKFHMICNICTTHLEDTKIYNIRNISI